MKKELQSKVEQLNKARGRKLIWYRVVSILACITVFFTTYMLILPAITATSDDMTVCGLVEHHHDEVCYDENGEIVCGKEEHEHDMLCFAEQNAVSPVIEYACYHSYEHTHSEECYTNGVLVCSLNEHTHSESCVRCTCYALQGEEHAVTCPLYYTNDNISVIKK